MKESIAVAALVVEKATLLPTKARVRCFVCLVFYTSWSSN